MLPAFAGLVLMLVAGLTSWRVARRRMAYETWWVTHLYFYLAIALAYLHQITLGQPFATHTWARWAWIGLYVITFVPLLLFRVALPLVSSLRHDLKVHAVVRESADTISVWISGRNLAALDVRGGQFFGWRFLTRAPLVAVAPLLDLDRPRRPLPAHHGEGPRRPQPRPRRPEARHPRRGRGPVRPVHRRGAAHRPRAPHRRRRRHRPDPRP